MRIALAALGLVGWLGASVPAAADPAPPVDPLLPVPIAPPPPVTPQGLLGQATQALQTNPVAAMNSLLAASPQPPGVGLTPPPPGAPPVTDPLSASQFLRPQNFRMPTADQVSPYALAPNDQPSPFARIDAWKGVHALIHSNLGRMPGAELGQPLPGTAPPPGSNIPPGLEQFYAPPVDPLLLPTIPPPPG